MRSDQQASRPAPRARRSHRISSHGTQRVSHASTFAPRALYPPLPVAGLMDPCPLHPFSPCLPLPIGGSSCWGRHCPSCAFPACVQPVSVVRATSSRLGRRGVRPHTSMTLSTRKQGGGIGKKYVASAFSAINCLVLPISGALTGVAWPLCVTHPPNWRPMTSIGHCDLCSCVMGPIGTPVRKPPPHFALDRGLHAVHTHPPCADQRYQHRQTTGADRATPRGTSHKPSHTQQPLKSKATAAPSPRAAQLHRTLLSGGLQMCLSTTCASPASTRGVCAEANEGQPALGCSPRAAVK